MQNNLLLSVNNFDFSGVEPQYFVATVKCLTQQTQDAIYKILKKKRFNWKEFVEPLEYLERNLDFIWEKINLIFMVNGIPEVREAYNQAQIIMISYSNWYAHCRPLYRAFRQVLEKDPQLNNIQKNILTKVIQDFELSGVALISRPKKRFEHLTSSLAKISNRFISNLIEATAQTKLVVPISATKGLPDYFVKECKQGEQAVFPMDAPHYEKIITFAKKKEVRKLAFLKYQQKNCVTSLKNPLHVFNNIKNILSILKRRRKLVGLLNFPDYAHYSLATKMVKKPEKILEFLTDLAKKSYPKAVEEQQKLEKFAQMEHIEKVRPWDLAYLQEKLSKILFDFSEEDLRPYFPLEYVLEGMFTLVSRLFGIKIIEQKPPKKAWHPSVRYFQVWDEGGLSGSFYLDLFSRDYKQAGAWVGELQPRHYQAGELKLPVVYLVCNFLVSEPVLLKHGDVVTLLHEFGHVLQHVLTKVNYVKAAGTSGIPWDAVEISSQFMENFAWTSEGLNCLARHYQTGVMIPEKLLAKIVESHTFMAATMMLRQIEFAMIDLKLHLHPYVSWKEILALIAEIQKLTRVVSAYKRFNILPSFAHIFAGGYAAGYYSYKWAEVLASDIFARFQEEGIFNPQVGKDFYQCFLTTGGSEPPEVLFRRFRGRDPEITALLKANGIYD